MLGNQIRLLRTKKKLTQDQLAEMAQTSQSAISDIERGQRSSPSFHMIKRIADALGVDVNDLHK